MDETKTIFLGGSSSSSSWATEFLADGVVVVVELLAGIFTKLRGIPLIGGVEVGEGVAKDRTIVSLMTSKAVLDPFCCFLGAIFTSGRTKSFNSKQGVSAKQVQSCKNTVPGQTKLGSTMERH